MSLIEGHFNHSRIPLAAPGVMAKWQPKGKDLAACEALGRQVAQAVKED
ncbi:MAG TPA: hypothetical protein VMX94_12080 [Armatimonadota bacterium]|nr:hypothetical protein [Armatimonadota bacterium]